jgi:hypothetical protein
MFKMQSGTIYTIFNTQGDNMSNEYPKTTTISSNTTRNTKMITIVDKLDNGKLTSRTAHVAGDGSKPSSFRAREEYVPPKKKKEVAS